LPLERAAVEHITLRHNNVPTDGNSSTRSQ